MPKEIMTTNTKPFPPDTTTNDIVAAARESLRAKHRQHVAEAKAKFEQESEKAWAKHEADRRAKFESEYRESHWLRMPYPHASLTDAEVVRVAAMPEDRIHILGEHGYFEELLYVLLARIPERKATVRQIQEWFKPYMSVEGDSNVIQKFPEDAAREVVHAAGLSKRLASLLADTWLIETRFGEVEWCEKEFDPAEY